MKKHRRLLTAFIGGILISTSCLTNTNMIKEEVYYHSGKPDKTVFYNLILEDIVIRSELEEAGIKENTLFILNLLKNKYEQQFKEKAVTIKDLYVRLIIKEEIFVKEFENLNSIGIEIESFIKKEGGSEDIEISALYAGETKDTIASYSYLYIILERIFRKIFY